MSELEHANSVLAEAREVLKKSEDNLSKSLKLHDLALVQHRKLAYALSCLVHPIQTLTPMSEEEQEQLIKTLREMPTQPIHFVPKEPVFANGRMIGLVDSSHEAIEHREVYDIVNAINVLAMANTDVIHIFISFSGHVNKLSVHANDTDTCYQNGQPHIKLMNENVWLDDKGALEKLLSIESQLTELIIEAREKNEANAEVES